MNASHLLPVVLRASIVVVGIPECWVDVRRVAELVRRQPANDNGRPDLADSSGERS